MDSQGPGRQDLQEEPGMSGVVEIARHGVAEEQSAVRSVPRNGWVRWIVAVASVVVVLASVGWYKLYREVAVEYANDDDNFKYGSIGTEDAAGLPFYVWKVLPRVCPDLVPGHGGYAAFGMIYEPGHEAPIGFSVKTI